MLSLEITGAARRDKVIKVYSSEHFCCTAEMGLLQFIHFQKNSKFNSLVLSAHTALQMRLYGLLVILCEELSQSRKLRQKCFLSTMRCYNYG